MSHSLHHPKHDLPARPLSQTSPWPWISSRRVSWLTEQMVPMVPLILAGRSTRTRSFSVRTMGRRQRFDGGGLTGTRLCSFALWPISMVDATENIPTNGPGGELKSRSVFAFPLYSRLPCLSLNPFPPPGRFVSFLLIDPLSPFL